MRITIFEHERDSTGSSVEVTWEELKKALGTHIVTACNPCPGHECEAKKVQAWSPATFSGRKTKNNVKEVSLLVLDYDLVSSEELSALRASLEGKAWLLHSTHAPDSYRAVIQLSRPVLPKEWSAFSANVAAKWPKWDPQAQDSAHIYFVPSTPASRPGTFEAYDGAPLETSELLEDAARPPVPAEGTSSAPAGTVLSIDKLPAGVRKLAERALAGQPLAKVGERDHVINRIMSSLAFSGLSKEAALELVSPSIRAMDCEPEGFEHWHAKADNSFDRATARRDIKLRQENQDRDQLASVLPAAPSELHVTGKEEWASQLVRMRDRDGNPVGLKPCDLNLRLIFENDERLKSAFRFNEVTKDIEVSGLFKGMNINAIPFEVSAWLGASEYRLHANKMDIRAAIAWIAQRNKFDPLKDYLHGLKWDGTARGSTLFDDYLKADKYRFNMILSQKWLLSAVARGLEPGCKVDTCLILQGAYGTRKTSFVSTMGGPFYSNARIDFTSKDGRQAASRFWIVELAELAGLHRAARESIKDWMSTQVDAYRPPYATAIEEFPRRSVFVGTTNDSQYLPEPNRREWVIKVGGIDLERLRQDRDQLWAEAVDKYKESEVCPKCEGIRCDEHAWWLTTPLEVAVGGDAKRAEVPDAIRDQILDWWIRTPQEKRPAQMTVTEVAIAVLGFSRDRVTNGVASQIGRSLKQLGFYKRYVTVGPGLQRWIYYPGEVLSAVPTGAKSLPADIRLVNGDAEEAG